MTTTRHAPAILLTASDQLARTSRPVAGQHLLTLSHDANGALLNHPAGRFNIDLLDTAGTYSFTYIRNPGARYVRIEARINALAAFGTGYATLDLTIRDGGGASVSSSNARIPGGFKGETHYARPSDGGPIVENQTIVTGYVDCDELDSTLTDPTWVFEFVLVVSGGAEVNSIQGQEMPRFLIDDSVSHGGIVPGSFQRDAPIDDDPVTGLERLLSTLASARAVERTYVSLAWRQQVVTTETPAVTSTSYTFLTGFSADSAPQTWQLRARQVYLAATAGEVVRYRVLYRMSGGAAQKGRFRLSGNATGSPWETGDLSYTTTWTWSAWITAAIRTSPTTDTLYLEARIEAGATLWCAGVDVREAVA